MKIPSLRDVARALPAFFFGRDVFISYSYKDSGYAEALAVAVGTRKLSVFLGAWGASPGHELSLRVRTAMEYSRLLVIVATPHSRRSKPVETEIASFTRRHRPVVPVDVGLNMADPKTEWPALAGTDIIRQENDAQGKPLAAPSDAVIDRILNSVTFVRQETRLRRVLVTTVTLVAVLIAAAAGIVAWSRATARDAEVRAENANTVARASTTTTARLRGEARQAITDRDTARSGLDVAQAELVATERKRAAAAASAEREASIAASIRTANQAAILLEQQPSRIAGAMLLAIEAVRHLHQRGVRALASDSILRATLDLLPRIDHHSMFKIARPDAPRTTPDGRWITERVCAHDVDVIDGETGERLHLPVPSELRGSASFAFSANGGVLAGVFERARGSDGPPATILVWDIATRALLHIFPAESYVHTLAVSPRGEHIAYSGYANGKHGARVISGRDGAIVASTFVPPPGAIWYELAFSASGNLLALGSSPPSVWPWRAGKEPIRIGTDPGDLLFNPADEAIIAICAASGVSVWRWADAGRADAAPLFTARSVKAPTFSSDGETLAMLASTEPQAQVVKWSDGHALPAIVPIRPGGSRIAVRNSGDRIAVASGDGTVDAYDVGTLRRIARVPHHAQVMLLRMLDDGAIHSVSGSGAMIWRPVTGEVFADEKETAAISANCRVIVSIRPSIRGLSGEITVHDDTRGVTKTTTRLIWTAVAAADDGTLFGGMYDGRVVRYSPGDASDESGTLIATAPGPVRAIALGHRGRLAWAAGSGVFVRDETGRVRTLAPATADVRAVAFGPGAATVAAGAEDGTVRLWRLDEPRRQPAALFRREKGVTALSISHDGRYVAAAGGPELTRIWLVANPRQTWTIPADAPSSIAFEPFGNSILIGSVNGVASVWSEWRQRPIEVARFTHDWNVLHARFSDDGMYIVTLPHDGQGARRLWSNEALVAAACQRLLPLRHSGELSAYDVVCPGARE